MKVVIDILEKSDKGAFRLRHSATNDDASTFDYGGVVRVTNVSGEALHWSNFDNMLGFFVINTGTTNIKARFPTDSKVPAAVNDVTLTPGQFIFIPKPEHAASKVISVWALTAGDVGEATYFISGD